MPISNPAGPDWIIAHRAAWARKPALRSVYGGWFAQLLDACRDRPIVELGCGPGFFKESLPELIATDVIHTPHANVVCEAAALPFGTAEIGAIVFIDVFHHLPRPAAFLSEAARVLRAGGRVAMIEPWLGLAGRLFFRWLHHEDCDASVDPAAPWGNGGKTPMLGNAALPFLYFRERGHLERLGVPLRVVRREPFAALTWLLSGGFQPAGLLPARLVARAAQLDRLLSAAAPLTALRCLVVLERTG